MVGTKLRLLVLCLSLSSPVEQNVGCRHRAEDPSTTIGQED